MEKSIDPLLLQLRVELNNYIKYFNLVKEKYEDVTFLAWLSVDCGESDWPETGEFIKARKDGDFRNFRAAFKKCNSLMTQFSYGLIDTDIANGYRKRLLELNPDATPF